MCVGFALVGIEQTERMTQSAITVEFLGFVIPFHDRFRYSLREAQRQRERMRALKLEEPEPEVKATFRFYMDGYEFGFFTSSTSFVLDDKMQAFFDNIVNENLQTTICLEDIENERTTITLGLNVVFHCRGASLTVPRAACRTALEKFRDWFISNVRDKERILALSKK